MKLGNVLSAPAAAAPSGVKRPGMATAGRGLSHVLPVRGCIFGKNPVSAEKKVQVRCSFLAARWTAFIARMIQSATEVWDRLFQKSGWEKYFGS